MTWHCSVERGILGDLLAAGYTHLEWGGPLCSLVLVDQLPLSGPLGPPWREAVGETRCKVASACALEVSWFQEAGVDPGCFQEPA